MYSSPCRIPLAILLSILSVAGAAPGPAEEPIVPIPLPTGVADPAGKIGNVVGIKGHIEAIDLEKGELLWEATVPAQPLIVFDTSLAALMKVPGKPNTGRIIVLDVKEKGKKVFESEPVVFPTWVRIPQALGWRFSSQASVFKGELILKWQAYSNSPGDPDGKEASGVARVNLSTGNVTMVDSDKPPDDSKLLPASLKEVLSERYWAVTAWKTTPFVIGQTVSALSVEERQVDGSRMSLKRWDLKTGKPLETVELLKGKRLWAQASAEGKYLFVRQIVMKDQSYSGEYTWWVFALDTGKLVAKHPFEGLLEKTTVLGGRLYYQTRGQTTRKQGEWVQPREIQVVDLQNGKLLWSRPLEGLLIPGR
jgi:hypothetical protein